MEPCYAEGGAALPRPRHARRRPDRAAGERALSRTRPSATSRASSTSRTTSRSTGLRPFHVPLGIMLNEKDRRASRCIRCETCDGFPCLVQAKADAQVCCVEPGAGPPERHAPHRARRSRASTPTRAGRRVTKVSVERERRAPRNTRPTSSSSPAARSTRRRCSCGRRTTGTRTASRTARDVVGRHYMGHVNSVLLAISRCPNPTVFQKTLGVNDFYFASKEWELPDGPHLLRRQARRRRALGGRAGDRARDSRSS